MKFIVDAHLPRRIATLFRFSGHNALHTLGLPNGNRSTEMEIIQVSAIEDRIVVTKDSDFVHSFHLSGEPRQLLLISTSNISNSELEGLLVQNLDAIEAAFASSNLVELTRSRIITRI